MKRCLGMAFALALVCALAACSPPAAERDIGDIVFRNDTQVAVSHVQVGTEVGMNADGTPIRGRDWLAFDMTAAPVTVTAYGADGGELASCTLREMSPGQWLVQLTGDGAGALTLKTKLLEP